MDLAAFSKFKAQRNNAKQRGVEWCLSFAEWMSVWDESGLFSHRGRSKDSYVMARKGDVGPYAIGNVFICTHAENGRDSRLNNPRTTEDLRGKTIGSGNGWSVSGRSKRNPYFVSVSKKYVGCFKDVTSAEAAYRLAVSEMVEFGCLKTRYRKTAGGSDGE